MREEVEESRSSSASMVERCGAVVVVVVVVDVGVKIKTTSLLFSFVVMVVVYVVDGRRADTEVAEDEMMEEVVEVEVVVVMTEEPESSPEDGSADWVTAADAGATLEWTISLKPSRE